MTEARPAAGQEEVVAALALRHLVFVVEQGVAPDLELDGRDGDAEHLVAVRDGRVVGTCRLLHEGGRTKLQRMAVERALRGQGIAGVLLDEAERAARRAGSARVDLSAQIRAVDVYARAGYAAQGPVYLEAGIEHRDMTKDL
ncbi:MAG TPA: GNAT family N-acetyltransferase [Baekduia sp.]|nr:GNAT family N-acetyltransferase [Baekduia sp.]